MREFDMRMNVWLSETVADYEIEEYESSMNEGALFFTLRLGGLKVFVTNREELAALRTALDDLSLKWAAADARKAIEGKEGIEA